MADDRIERAAGMLEEASKLLRTPTSTDSSIRSTNRHESQESSGIEQALQRAQSMLRSSSSSGLCRRLSKTERLRASSSQKGKNSPSVSGNSKKSKKEKKPFEFALLRSWDEEEEEDESYTIKWDSVIAEGLLEIEEEDDESTIRKALQSALLNKFPVLGVNDFDFAKVKQKRVSFMELCPGSQYNYPMVKKLAGQGILYIKMKQGYEFVYDGKQNVDNVNMDEDPEKYSFVEVPNPSEQDGTPHSDTPVVLVHDVERSSQVPLRQANASERDDFFSTVVKEFPSTIVEPTEMLRYLQKKIVQGRALEITNLAVDLEGDVNFITVDRDNILKTTFDELKNIDDPRITFQVQFYEENAVDSGGPRKEWIRLCNMNIKQKYFEHGLQSHLSEDYFLVGQMVGIALLQNGQLPVFIPEEVLQEVFSDTAEPSSPCVKEIKRGMDTLGLPMFGRKFPVFVHLLRPNSSSRLSVPKLLHLLKPKFSEEGSNSRVYEKDVYGKFVKYVRSTSSGNRVTTLENILEFVTGASEEPALGFERPPCIQFVRAEPKELNSTTAKIAQDSDQVEKVTPLEKKRVITDFIPKSHTCSNTLDLPRGSTLIPLPSEDELFRFYDYAFKNTHFGLQ